MSALAIDGGAATRQRPLPSAMSREGRCIGEEEERAVLRVLRSGMLSGVWGSETPALSREFADLLGAQHAVTCSSGTAALHLALAAVDPEPGDEIIVPPISDIGTIAPVLAQNAIPVFADVDPMTGCLDPDRVAELVGPRTRAIMVVHLFGRSADVVRLRELADAANLVLIEDCAQAFLARAEDGGDPSPRLVGTVGHIGCFSLQQHKHITTGDGGLVVTDDGELATRMRRFADKGWPRETGERAYLHFALNYRMTELVAAVAREQVRKLPDVVARRRAKAARLDHALSGLERLTVPPSGPNHAYWYYPIVMEGLDNRTLHWFAGALTAEGVPTIPGYLARPLYAEPVLRHARTYGASGYPIRGARQYGDGLCPVADSLIYRRLLVLPCNENFTDGDVDDIAAATKKVHAASLVGRDDSGL